MNDAQRERTFEIAASCVVDAMFSAENRPTSVIDPELNHLQNRMATYSILLADEIDRLRKTNSRAAALALIFIADLCWQILRALSGRTGDIKNLIDANLPKDWKESDQDIGDEFFALQQQIVDDANWIYSLHTSLRHPKIPNPDLIALLREPVDPDKGARLLRAACGIRQLWLNTQAKYDPHISATT